MTRHDDDQSRPTIGLVGEETVVVDRLGADPQQLRSLARQLEIEGDRLEGMFRALSGRLDSTWWQGADANSFRDRWQQHHHSRLRSVIRELHTAASELRSHAARQEQASRT